LGTQIDVENPTDFMRHFVTMDEFGNHLKNQIIQIMN